MAPPDIRDSNNCKARVACLPPSLPRAFFARSCVRAPLPPPSCPRAAAAAASPHRPLRSLRCARTHAQVCGYARLLFEPPTMYCMLCGQRIKRGQVYYGTPPEYENKGCWCHACYTDIKGEFPWCVPCCVRAPPPPQAPLPARLPSPAPPARPLAPPAGRRPHRLPSSHLRAVADAFLPPLPLLPLLPTNQLHNAANNERTLERAGAATRCARGSW